MRTILRFRIVSTKSKHLNNYINIWLNSNGTIETQSKYNGSINYYYTYNKFYRNLEIRMINRNSKILPILRSTEMQLLKIYCLR